MRVTDFAGWKAICVPGELHGMWTEYQKFGGGVPWKEIVQPTVDLVENGSFFIAGVQIGLKDKGKGPFFKFFEPLSLGYPVTGALAAALHQYADYLKNEPTMRPLINPTTGDVYKEGDRIKTRFP